MNDKPSPVGLLDAPPPAAGLAIPRDSTKPTDTTPFRRILTMLPNVLVLAFLAGLGWWGHHTGWKLPKFSQLAGTASEEADDWCAEHTIAESDCVECNVSLMPRRKIHGWCEVHGVHECPFEHPVVAELKSPPTVTPDMLERAHRALKVQFTKRPANSKESRLHQRRIQFPSDAAVQKAGIDFAPVSEASIVEAITANGEVSYDQTLIANLSPAVSGRVWHVYKQQGQAVRKGDVLALVDAGEVGKTKAELVNAASLVAARSQRLESLKPLRGTAVPEATYLEAETVLREAQARLTTAEQALLNFGLPFRADDLKGLESQEMNRRVQFLGLPPEVARTLDPRTTTANLIPVKAPFDGVVITRKAAQGEQADPSRALFVVADTRVMWLTLNVRQEDARFVKARDEANKTPGQEVRFRSEALPEEITGEVVWVSTEVDEKTRTVQVRVNLPNRGGVLRAHVFGTGKTILREEKREEDTEDTGAIVVPNEAVQPTPNGHVVFVRDRNYRDRDAKKVFHTRSVRVGAKDETNTEIIAGVLPGEVVVTRGAGTLRSELLKNNLGAG